VLIQELPLLPVERFNFGLLRGRDSSLSTILVQAALPLLHELVVLLPILLGPRWSIPIEQVLDQVVRLEIEELRELGRVVALSSLYAHGTGVELEVLVESSQFLALGDQVVPERVGIDLLESLVAVLIEETNFVRSQKSQLDLLLPVVLLADGHHFLVLLAKARPGYALPLAYGHDVG